MDDCIFCKIIKGEIPSGKIYEDDTVLVFKDISPVTPIHYLAVPKEHIASAAEINRSNSVAVAHIFEVIAQIAEKENFADGYRVITNIGEDAGQTVKHLHFHILSGCKLNVSLN